SRGIGHATVRRLLQDGVSVVAVVRNARAVDDLRDIAPERCGVVTCDLGIPADRRDLVSRCTARFAGLDGWGNCAGIAHQGAHAQTGLANDAEDCEVNYVAA